MDGWIQISGYGSVYLSLHAGKVNRSTGRTYLFKSLKDNLILPRIFIFLHGLKFKGKPLVLVFVLLFLYLCTNSPSADSWHIILQIVLLPVLRIPF